MSFVDRGLCDRKKRLCSEKSLSFEREENRPWEEVGVVLLGKWTSTFFSSLGEGEGRNHLCKRGKKSHVLFLRREKAEGQ